MVLKAENIALRENGTWQVMPKLAMCNIFPNMDELNKFDVVVKSLHILCYSVWPCVKDYETPKRSSGVRLSFCMLNGIKK
jgi:hypothetical protein